MTTNPSALDAVNSHSPASIPELPKLPEPAIPVRYVPAGNLAGCAITTPRSETFSVLCPQRYFTADQMNAHYLKGYEAGSAAAAQAVPKGWREALQFYADRSHFALADENAWDTVSGEPSNFWCDEAGTATVEDGTVAAMALAGTPLPDDEDTAPTQGAEGAAPQASEQSTFLSVAQTVMQRLHNNACAARYLPGNRIVVRFDAVVDAIQEIVAVRRTPSPTATAPPEADALREAAQAVVHSHKHHHNYFKLGQAINALSAALAQHQPQQGEERGTAIEQMVRAEPWLKSAEVRERLEDGE